MCGFVSQDRAYTLELLLALLEMYGLEWQEHGYSTPMISIYSICLTCLGGMHVYEYEAVWTNLGSL